MKFAICNEMFADWDHAQAAEAIASAGYTGVELAPFTLGDTPTAMPPTAVRTVRAAFTDAGLSIIGLHWLLAKTNGLSITSPDEAVLARTAEHLRSLIRLCRDLGGPVMVFGSPAQRSLEPGWDAKEAFERVTWLFKDLAFSAVEAGVTICFEPLTSKETNFINTCEDGVRLVEAVNHPAFQLHLDVKAMSGAESRPPADIVRAEGGRHLRHFHANDPNLLGPGMGEVDHRPIGHALREIGYKGWVSVETFAPGPGPEEIARQSMTTLRACYGEVENDH
jgi:sugar phosphate isomerase/epimerase